VIIKGGKIMVPNNSNPKKQENSLKTDGVTQPLMSTGTTEPSFDWVTNATSSSDKPKIGNTVIGEKESNGRNTVK
jgi:hypothetical protein